MNFIGIPKYLRWPVQFNFFLGGGTETSWCFCEFWMCFKLILFEFQYLPIPSAIEMAISKPFEYYLEELQRVNSSLSSQVWRGSSLTRGSSRYPCGDTSRLAYGESATIPYIYELRHCCPGRSRNTVTVYMSLLKGLHKVSECM